MVKQTSDGTLLTHLQALGLNVDFLREALRLTAQLLIELEVSAAIEAVPYERKGARKAYRNGYRQRQWRTELGEIPLRIPKLRQGSYYPELIDSLPDAEPLLLALVQDAYVQGASMRHVEELLYRIGLPPVHKSQIAAISERLDDLIYQFRQRPLDASYSELWLDVLTLNVQRADRLSELSVALAVGIEDSGRREILGFEVSSQATDRDFWRAFLRDLVRRGLRGVEAVTGDAHEGLRPAVREVFGDMVSLNSSDSFVSAIATQHVDTALSPRAPRAALLGSSAADVVSLFVLASVQRALARPTEAVGFALDEAVISQLVGALVIAVDAEWNAVRHQLEQPLAA